MEETSNLEKTFVACWSHMEDSVDSGKLKLSNNEKLTFYGLYKFAANGECKVEAPSRLRIIERAKWDAWKKMGNSMT